MFKTLEKWAPGMKRRHPELLHLGVFGSFARGDSGVGSDVDMIAIVSHAALPFEKRPVDWDLSDLPVPVDLLVYTIDEWRRLQEEPNRFIDTLKKETVWLKTDP